MTTATMNGTHTIDLADLFARRVQTVQIQITDDPGDTFAVRYKPDAFTKEVQAELQLVQAEDAAAVALARLIVDWDLTVDGQPYPVTQGNLEALGFPLLMAIGTVVMEDFNTRIRPPKAPSTAPSVASNGT